MGYFRYGDPLDDFEANERRKEAWLNRRPVCSCCKANIQDEEALHFGDTWVCLECIEDNMELIDE